MAKKKVANKDEVFVESAEKFIKEHPFISVIGAAVIGYATAKVLTRKK